jgi:hypothetical protein
MDITELQQHTWLIHWDRGLFNFFFARLALNHDLPALCFLSSGDYRHETPCPTHSNLILFYFFSSTGVWTRGLQLARQAFYHLSHPEWSLEIDSWVLSHTTLLKPPVVFHLIKNKVLTMTYRCLHKLTSGWPFPAPSSPAPLPVFGP